MNKNGQPMQTKIEQAKANVSSWRGWGRGALQAVIYGIGAAIVSVVGINGVGNLVEIEPLNWEQLGGVLVSCAVGRLAQYMLATPIPGVSE